MELLIFLAIWTALAVVPLFFLREPVSKFHDDLASILLSFALSPLMPFIVASSNRDYWIKSNLKACRALLEPWDIYIEVTSIRSKNNLYISWAFNSHMSGRKYETRVPAYKALRELEKMPVDQWAMKYLPRTEEVKGVNPETQVTFKPYRK
ncbi:hypothetical protein MYO4S_00217 [Serratia phage 4S]|nr:hypothetical protein MYO4S_00217 [Serratia phage 4S]